MTQLGHKITDLLLALLLTMHRERETKSIIETKETRKNSLIKPQQISKIIQWVKGAKISDKRCENNQKGR